jgi:hypothetical protein
MSVSGDPWVWLSALLTLAILSYLYKDNPLYKAAEYLFVGVASGYYLSIQWDNVLIPNLFQPVAAGVGGLFQGDPGSGLWRIGALILGVLMFSRFSARFSWLSRWPLGFMVGAFAALAVLGASQGDLIEQVRSNLIPVVADGAWDTFRAADGFTETLVGFLGLLSNAVLILGVIACLYYFFFSTEHRGVSGGVARAGIYLLMISFGASYGFTVMGRISLALDRLKFLYADWLGLPILQ